VASKAEDKSNLVVPLAIVAALLPIIGGAWWYLERSKRDPVQQPGITAEGKLYVRNLKLSDVEMKATANYAGGTVVEIMGKIANNGDRTLQRVDLTCVFYDPGGLVVLRERVPIVRATLRPGETRTFRLPFEGIPQSWNQAMPQLVIASVQFGS
jgi:hypothetical protein